ncbi:ABC transporter ATP-binding protein [Phaeobacter sp. 22II1-1F12B]|uniref:ABC transporter ATP-binding protein n=1 Tax=Phaeobacter sp. 22II1-1F12B TaxID=1317111 RepID=UPI000B51E955|nr:ABC transporter ATP-binding protein [Phaeobacter sp. 22II1-1F12B]OWU72774.1 hypothetical protein ATO1_21705 [Phaeobacter sp. 22II1-1F12B]
MNAQSPVTPLATDIRITGLSKYFGNFGALLDIELKVAPGEFLTLLGPSGSGKSTLLMSIAGFVEPSAGNILVGGKSVISTVPEKRNFGVVFQGYALFPHMTVKDNLAYPLKVRGVPKAQIAAKVQETLELVQLSHLASRYPKQLSGGQQQRVALARALVFSPEILLLDEPMGALDKKLRHDLQLELRQLHRRLGRTFVNVTHDQEEAMAMSDRIAIMNAGRIIQVGRPRDLYDAPKTRFIADFLGKSNFLTGRVSEISASEALIETDSGMIRHRLRESEGRLSKGREVHLALRPEQITLGEAPNTLSATVESAIFLGNYAEVTVRTERGLQIVGQMALRESEQLPVEGAQIKVGWEPSATVIVEPD